MDKNLPSNHIFFVIKLKTRSFLNYKNERVFKSAVENLTSSRQIP